MPPVLDAPSPKNVKPTAAEAEAALRICGAADVREHDAEMADHRQRAPRGVAVVMFPARLGRPSRRGEVLVEMLAEVASPDEVPAEPAMGKRDDVGRLVGEELPTATASASLPWPPVTVLRIKPCWKRSRMRLSAAARAASGA